MAVKPKHSGGTGDGGSHGASARKVKTGCHTCKRRKVKCDEIWPVCRRCESTGRTCDGYGIWGGGNKISNQLQHHHQYKAQVKPTASHSYPTPDSAASSPTKCMQLIPFRSGEMECFEWFIHRSSIKLPGVFRCHHWTTLLFQASTAEPAVRHAVLALGSAHKEEVRGDGYSGRERHDEQTLFTVAQYSKAIHSLQSYVAGGRKASTQVALISCALFVSMELLRGSYVNALLHLEYGLNLLAETETSVKGQDPWSVSVKGWVITLLTRQFVQAKLLGQLQKLPCRRFLHLYNEPMHDTFRSIHHARRSLEHVIVCAFDIQEQSQRLVPCANHEMSQELLDYRRNTQDTLEHWLKTRDATVAALPSTSDMTERFAYRLLLLYHQVALILIDTCLELDGELCFDRYDTNFLEIISHCVSTYKLIFPNGKRNPKSLHDPEPTSPNSISDIGWIAPLYFTAIKCRNPRIRRQAIRLLQSTMHKEGIWNAALVIPVAQKVIELEEHGFYKSLLDTTFKPHDIPAAGDLLFPKLPLGSRVSRINISLPEDRAGRLVFSCCRFQSDGVVEQICEEYDLRTQQWNENGRMFRNMFTPTVEVATQADENTTTCVLQGIDELITLSSTEFEQVY